MATTTTTKKRDPDLDLDSDNRAKRGNFEFVGRHLPKIYGNDQESHTQLPELASREAVVNAEPILTSSAPLVSYGMISDVAIRLRDGWKLQKDHIFIVTSTNQQRFIKLYLSLKGEDCMLYSSGGKIIGAVNMKISRILNRLRDSPTLPQLMYECLLAVPESTNAADPLAGFSSRDQIADINIYGRRQGSKAVGWELGRKKIYLQESNWTAGRIPYNNPQDIDIPAEYDICEEDDLEQGNGRSGKSKAALQSILDDMDPSAMNFDVILDSLAHQDYLVQLAADEKIETKLLGHQKQGLDFIGRRESNSASSRSLWKAIESGTGDFIYEHVITGAKSHTPALANGGIIADEMGLGKSLIMISAVMGSLSHALSYACTVTSRADGVGSAQTIVAAKSTLIIVPSAILMDHWIDEIIKHTTRGSLTYHKYHGLNKNIGYPTLLQNDIILTTYGTLAAEFSRGHRLLHKISWYRVVLDEAHVIRNASTKQFRAVSSLNALIRWCLTGTPIQNSLDDLGSLVKFLREQLLEDTVQFKRHITSAIRQRKKTTWRDFENLRILLSTICLRRNKHIMPFSESNEHVYELEFSLMERAGYTGIGRACKKAIELAVSGHTDKHTTVLEMILRLRLFCNNAGAAATSLRDALVDPEEVGSLLQQQDEANCHYCSCDIVSFSDFGKPGFGIITHCRRAVCAECVTAHRKPTPGSLCSICGTPDEFPAHASSKVAGLSPASLRYPTKVVALCDDLQRYNGESKSIVFTCWKKSLNIVEALLRMRSIPYLRIDGDVTLAARKIALSRFQKPNEPSVLLMTLGTGAVGLNNLTVANRIHILEPQWNPSVESQAIGRVVRLGQERPVQIIRYIMKASVEMNVRNRQIQKLHLSKGVFGGGNASDGQQKARLLMDMVCPLGGSERDKPDVGVSGETSMETSTDC